MYVYPNNVGHEYGLENFEAKGVLQNLKFIKKEAKDGATEMKTVQDGTTNEELLEVLIHRLNFLNSKFPCRENSIVITKLEECLMWLNKRTKDRLNRGVEGTHQK